MGISIYTLYIYWIDRASTGEVVRLHHTQRANIQSTIHDSRRQNKWKLPYTRLIVKVQAVSADHTAKQTSPGC